MKKETEEDKKILKMGDTNCAFALISCGFVGNPVKNEGRVVFEFENSPELQATVQNYNSHKLRLKDVKDFSVKQFLEEWKNLKAVITFLLKQQDRPNGGYRGNSFDGYNSEIVEEQEGEDGK